MKGKKKMKWRPRRRTLKSLGNDQGKRRHVADKGSTEAGPGSEERYALSLLEKSSDLTLVIDDRANAIYLSPSVEDLLGYRPEEVLGLNAFDFIHPDDVSDVSAFFQEAISRSGFSSHISFRVRHVDGTWRFFEAVGNTLLEDPQIKGIVVNARDITEQVNLAENIRKTEERYYTILDSANDAVLIHNIPSGELIYANKRMTEMFGYTLEEARGIGLKAFDRNQGPYTQKRIVALAEEAAAGEPQLYEWQPVNKYGKPFWVEVNQRRARIGENDCILSIVRDITDRKAAEEALQRSQEYFRALIEHSSDITAVLDASGIIRYISPSVEQQTGYSQDELTGRNVFGFAHPDDIQNSTEALAYATRKDGITRYAGIRIHHKDGSWHYYETSSNNLLDNPFIQGIVINARDITERKQAERALRESEEKHRLIYDHTGDAIFTYDEQLRVQSVNLKACELIGYTEEELLGQHVFEIGILHQDDYEKASKNLAELLQGKVVSDELRFIRKDGSVLLGEMTSAGLYDKNGDVMMVTNVIRDITERKKEEERLERLNRCLLGLGPDPLENIINITLTGRVALGASMFCYCRMDRGRLHLFSTASEEERFTKPSNAEDYIAHYIIASRMSAPLVLEKITGTEFEGDPFVLQSRFKSFLGYPVRPRGNTIGCICHYDRDQRDFPREEINFLGMLARALTVEEERLAHEEGIRHFVDIASHELRTPLSIIKGYAEAFMLGDLLELSDFQLEKISMINANADKMTKTINDLLDLSRIERGIFTIDKQIVELDPLVRIAIRQMHDKGVTNHFVVCLAHGMERIWADPEKLIDLMIILLDNAVNYSPPASEISIEAESLDHEVVISILDRGAGIPQKDQRVIFERFFQVRDSESSSATGMGLGLYIAHEIVKGHNGRIWYESRLGGGSIFRCAFPSTTG